MHITPGQNRGHLPIYPFGSPTKPANTAPYLLYRQMMIKHVQICYRVKGLWHGYELLQPSRVSTTFVSSEWSHGMYYEDLPYFPLNQDPNGNLEGEIHDKMKDTWNKKKYAKSVNNVPHRSVNLLIPQLIKKYFNIKVMEILGRNFKRSNLSIANIDRLSLYTSRVVHQASAYLQYL